MNLSTNFTLAEFTRSSLAARLGWANAPPPDAIARLRLLCAEVLEPVRAHFAAPIIVRSGYRSPALNQRPEIGGAPTSQHCLGEAADIEIAGVSNFDLASFIVRALPFDQCILELYTPGQPNSGWVHVSYRAGRLRRQALTATPKKTGRGMDYRPGLIA